MKINFFLRLTFTLYLGFFILSCQKQSIKIDSFSMCRQTEKISGTSEDCIPPLWSTQAIYYFINPNLSSNMQDYLNSLADAKYRLAFCARLNRNLNEMELKNWQANLKAFYLLSDSNEMFKEQPSIRKEEKNLHAFHSLRFLKNSICAEITLKEVLNHYYPQASTENYHFPKPIPVQIQLLWQENQQKKILIKRSLNLEIKHETK